MSLISLASRGETHVSELMAVSQALGYAKPHSLESEVMWSAMRYLKENPHASIWDAVRYGVNEWDV